MSAQFKPGDPVWIYPAELDGKPAWAVQRQTTVTEPEDKADLYVEPEPLKNGAWAQAWVRVVDASVIGGEVTICAPRMEGDWRYLSGAVRISEDAIIRTDAAPPWVKPARCTSLAEDSGVYYRCQHDEHADDEHRHEDSIIRTWPTSEESGRITEGGAS